MIDIFDRLKTAFADRCEIERHLGEGGSDRFQQEITTTTGLSHQHILPLLDWGAAAGFLCHVMPYVEGDTLHHRLKRERQLPVEENRLIPLSIRYDACSWRHVREHESFENEEIAASMNQHYVNIKVDREERPDLEPVFAGTYFPPTDQFGGRPGFTTLLTSIVDRRPKRRQACAY